MKCAATLGIFFLLPYLFRLLFKNPNVTRRGYAFLTSLLLAIANFLLVVMFVEENTIAIGIIMFLITIISGYPTGLLLYPFLRKSLKSET